MAKTWKVLDEGFEPTGEPIPLDCDCGVEALCPTHGHPGDVIVSTGHMGIVYDHPWHQAPEGYLPRQIKCRYCRRVFELSRGWTSDVR